MQARTSKRLISLSDKDPINYNALAGTTEGYSPSDIMDFVGRSVHAAAVRQGEKVCYCDADIQCD